MRHVYPSAYRDFACIASACRHTCCVGWALPVDRRTARRYRRLRGALGEHIRATLNEEGDAFIPTEEGRCPHLDEQNLCRLIRDGSQDLLCTVCREHPRYHNSHGRTVTEHGLGLSCEEACRLLLNTPLSFVFADGTPVGLDALRHGRDGDYLCEKYRLLDIFFSSVGATEERIAVLAKELGISLDTVALSDAILLLPQLEFLEQGSAELFSRILTFSPISDNYSLQYSNFLTLTFYRTASQGTNLTVAACFSVFLLRLLDALVQTAPKNDENTVLNLARTLSAEIEYSEENTERLLTYFEEKNLLLTYQNK